MNIHTSMDLMYDTRGRLALIPDAWVVMVSTVNKPREILAGTAFMSIQNDTQDRVTIRILGMYTWIR